MNYSLDDYLPNKPSLDEYDLELMEYDDNNISKLSKQDNDEEE